MFQSVNILFDLLSDVHIISFSGCMLQAYIIYSSVCSDFSILALMAYDRYVAICRPLQYHAVMTRQQGQGEVYADRKQKNLKPSLQNLLSIEFLIVAPIVNPLIYGLKLFRVRNRIKNVLK
ncbi:olfactory receptor 6Y1-like [Aplochiton taeniatus]